MTEIPARQPYFEVFTGAMMGVGDHIVVAPAPLPDVSVADIGQFVLRYGVEYLGKPQYSIVPGLIALDYGEMLVGEDAWDFLLNRSNLYPRAEVFGYRNDGVDDMITIKRLDLMPPIHVLAYADEHATTPLARIAAVIATAETPLPPWLARYGRRYSTLAEYQAQTL
jgi:hypothetical protein